MKHLRALMALPKVGSPVDLLRPVIICGCALVLIWA